MSSTTSQEMSVQGASRPNTEALFDQELNNKLGKFTLDTPATSNGSSASAESLCRHSSSSTSSIIREELPEALFSQRYETGSPLGKGGYGTVMTIREHGTGNSFAWKTTTQMGSEPLDWIFGTPLVSATPLWHEWLIHSQLDHPSIIRAYDYYKDPWVERQRNKSGMVMEKGGETLYDMVKPFDEYRPYYIGEVKMKSYLKDILLGLQYLKSKNIFHRDIKPENLILGSDGIVKIADFGLSVKLETGKRLHRNTTAGTCLYLAPECVAYSATKVGVGFEADIWAAGAVLWETLMGFTLYKEGSEINDMIRNEVPAVKGPKVSKQAKNLLQGMLHPDFKKRLTVEECLQHPWFNSL